MTKEQNILDAEEAYAENMAIAAASLAKQKGISEEEAKQILQDDQNDPIHYGLE
ncbi:hypothetical protein HLH10_16165 [Acinetobacter sp. ANC 4277]|uniref:hypothetical protein n=1 Tax=Acinetobacter terrae TaxID=2731247 RepID=UPI00148F5823|nr:hypothetical protein [Acinetobacter terrae]NNG77752.1 hypothetical protein [Acinetobacter terrae]